MRFGEKVQTLSLPRLNKSLEVKRRGAWLIHLEGGRIKGGQNNQMLSRVERLANEKLLNCDPFIEQKISPEKQAECITWDKTI